MTRKSIPLLCYWDGKISHGTQGITYADANPKAIKVNREIKYSDLIDRTYELTRIDSEKYKVKIICRYLANGQYVALVIDNDESVDIMLDVTEEKGINCVELYIEKSYVFVGSQPDVHISVNDGGNVGARDPSYVYFTVKSLTGKSIPCRMKPDTPLEKLETAFFEREGVEHRFIFAGKQLDTQRTLNEVMNRKNISLLCHWDGKIARGSQGITYEDAIPKAIKVNCEIKYSDLIEKIYALIGIDCEKYKLKIICRYLANGQYIALPIDNDESVDIMVDMTKEKGINCVELYIEKLCVSVRSQSILRSAVNNGEGEVDQKPMTTRDPSEYVHLTRMQVNVESYVYDMRNKLYDRYQDFVTEPEREELSAKLQQTEDWLYETKGVYIAKLEELKKQGDHIEERYKEHTERGPVIDQLIYCINSYREAAMSSDPRFDHIDMGERQKVLNECVEGEAWLREKRQQQDPLPKYVNPVLLSADIKKKAETLDRFCRPIMTKPKPSKPATPEPASPSPSQGDENTDSTHNGNRKAKLVARC